MVAGAEADEDAETSTETVDEQESSS
jgi:hypothetical protein